MPNLTHKEPVRFVGDLNPESILTDLSSRSKGSNRVSRIGTFVEQSKARPEELQIQFAEPSTTRSGEKLPFNVEKYGKGDGGRRTLTAPHRNYLQAVGAFRVLPKDTQDAMITTYISCIDGLIPILNGGNLLRDYTGGNISIFLVQAICLVTCKIPEVDQYLRLYEDGPLLDPIPFSRSLHIGLDAAMKADLEPDRMTKVQILTLMHLHNDGPGGIEESSQHLSQAIHDAWTAGLHIQTPGRTPTDEASLLWWMIWTLDRINACIGGRPIMIADRDIDLARPPLSVNRRAPITVWLRLGDLLDQIIDFYRPTADPDASGWEAEFPSWNSMLEDVDLENTLDSHLTVLELCYNVIAILSCRNASPTHASYTRRILAANRIESLLLHPTAAHPDTPTPLAISPIPLVPYAIGLSLTVAYRGLRDHSSDHSRTTSALSARCEMLESLSSRWWTADAMAKLGRKALKSMQNPVGLKRQEVADLENAMEAEVTVCKYGPFEGRKKDDGAIDGGGNGKGSERLHLLSDAAATHSMGSQGHPQQGASQQQQQQQQQSATVPTTDANTSTDTGTGSYQPTPMTDNLPTPGPGDQSATAIETGNGSGFTPAPLPLDFEKFDNAFTSATTFSDLDNIFDGFFDLSMPTVTFADPMFDSSNAMYAYYGGNNGAGDGEWADADDGGVMLHGVSAAPHGTRASSATEDGGAEHSQGVNLRGGYGVMNMGSQAQLQSQSQYPELT